MTDVADAQFSAGYDAGMKAAAALVRGLRNPSGGPECDLTYAAEFIEQQANAFDELASTRR